MINLTSFQAVQKHLLMSFIFIFSNLAIYKKVKFEALTSLTQLDYHPVPNPVCCNLKS